jgi:Nif-specific ferredoxin III
VLQRAGVSEEGELVPLAADVDDDGDDEYEKKVMTIANQMNCVGCEACMKICPKKCYTHAPMMEGG